MTAEDPLLLLRAILTHLSDPRLGADQNLLRVRMAYETVKMEQNDVLKYYYQRFKALKAGYEDTMRALGVMPDYNEAMTAHNEVLTGMKFMNGLNAGYRHYVEYYEHRLKDWPDTLEDAYLEMAKVTPKKSAAATPPNQTNVFATETAGGEKSSGAGTAPFPLPPFPLTFPSSAPDDFSPPAVSVAKTLVWLGGVAAADFFGVTLARYASSRVSGQSLSLCS